VTATAFERLLYTDCRAGEGRGGGTGFQIQAQSPGVTANLARLAEASLLYVAPTEWVTSRAVEDFPLGIAHAVGDGWGTAQSRYLGETVNKSRQGNHLADCLLTTDRGPYGAIRPAQLLESAVWRAVPFDTVDCPPFDDFLEPGPLTNDDIQAWLREDASRREVLARLVTVLEDRQGAQVVIVASTTEEAARWIAAATILLPIEAALDVSFKVFVADADRSLQRIVAIPKELDPKLTPEAPGSRFVIDATTGVGSGGETSERASYWLERLVEAADPYDVVEAVDFAHLLTGAPGDSREARETAWLITAGGETLTDPEPILAWLRRPKDPELAEHESAVASRLIASDLLDAGQLDWMERQADADRLYVDRIELRRALLAVEIGEVGTTAVDLHDDLTPVEVGDGPLRDAESEISSALLLATDGDVVDRLLRIARRHEVPLALDPLRDRLDEFVAAWIASPTAAYDPGKWALSDYIVGELARRLDGGGQPTGQRSPSLARARPLLEVAWPYLLQRAVDPARPLTWELFAASVANSLEGAKERELERAMRILAASPEPRAPLIGFQNALMRWQALSRAEAMSFTGMVPEGVPLNQVIADDAFAEIRRRAGRPDAALLDALRCLDRRRLLPRDGVTERLANADRSLTAFINVTRGPRWGDDLAISRELAQLDPRVLSARAPELVALGLEDRALPTLGAAILAALPRDVAGVFIDTWGRALEGEAGPIAAARGYLWSEGDAVKLPDGYRRGLADRLGAYAVSLDATEKEAWVRSVGSLLGPAAADFDAFLGGKRRPRLHVGRPRRG
jgi:hypothetical protein